MTALYDLAELFPNAYKPPFSDQLNALFWFIKQNKWLNEEEAAKQFMGRVDKRKHFNKLKNTLINNLTQELIVNPSYWANTKGKQEYDLFYKKFSAYKILLGAGKSDAAIKLGRKLLSSAQSLEFYAMAVDITSDLLFYFSGSTFSMGHYLSYQNRLERYHKLLNAEVEVKKVHSLVNKICTQKNSFSPEIIEQLRAATMQVLPYLDLNSNKLGRLIYNIAVAYHYAIFDYKSVVKYCHDALGYMTKDHLFYDTYRFAFLHKQIPSLIALADFEQANDVAEEAIQMMPAGSFNWHLLFLQSIIIKFHQGQYQDAYEMYKQNLKYGCKYKLLAEYYQVIRAYLYLLINVGMVTPYHEEKLNLGRFLNEVPKFSKDKAGLNINIIVLQILINLQRGRFGKVIDIAESLKMYAKKYTRNKETERANIFINFLLKAEAVSFHRAATERKTKNLYKKLTSNPIFLGQNIMVEIVPFEVLWKLTLDLLEDKFRGVTVRKKVK